VVEEFMIVHSGRLGRRAWYPRAAVKLAAPASRQMVITRVRRLAMMCGPLAVRTCERFLSKAMSRVQHPVCCAVIVGGWW
jgi:hypothetical protein